jgi:hypothetical protein
MTDQYTLDCDEAERRGYSRYRCEQEMDAADVFADGCAHGRADLEARCQQARASAFAEAARIVVEMSRYGGPRAVERAESIAAALVEPRPKSSDFWSAVAELAAMRNKIPQERRDLSEPTPEECARVVAELGINVPDLAARLRKQVADHFEAQPAPAPAPARVAPVDDARRLLAEAADLVAKYTGCGDNSCLFAKPKGMATNGGCQCIKHARPFVAAALAKLYRDVRAYLAAQPTSAPPRSAAVERADTVAWLRRVEDTTAYWQEIERGEHEGASK